MVIAIIDLGTNTFNLLIAEISENKTFHSLYNTRIAVKLGEGGIDKQIITSSAIERALNALTTFKNTIEHYHTDKIYAFATSAVRNASNQDEFSKIIFDKTGIPIHIIAGEKEAELIYYGIRQALEMNENKLSLILDIGGGSNEFIIANKTEIRWKKSFDLGVARLLETFKPSDPITKDEILKIENYLKENLAPLFKAIKDFPVDELIGSSGSFETFADMITCETSPEALKSGKEYNFDISEYQKLHFKLLNSTQQERLNMKGLLQMRADMIVIATIIVNLILTKLNLSKMRLSVYSLKEGAIWEIMHNRSI